MASNLRKTSKAAQAVESHWSLATIIKDNWSWIAPMLGLTGLTGWLAWAKQAALSAPWYDKGLIAVFSALITAFLILGVRAFWVNARRARREEGAIARGLAISGYTYGPGAVIDGGRHQLAEIFGDGRIVSNVVFRNAVIEGPGFVSYVMCDISHSTIFDTPAPMVIHPLGAEKLSQSTHMFFNCRFENCTITGLVQISKMASQPGEIARFKLVPIDIAEGKKMDAQMAREIEGL